MSGRLFLHIGPPKTATTSLQVALAELEHSQYGYQGAIQPRERNGGSVASLLHRAILGDEEAASQATEQLQAATATCRVTMLSEEMLSLEQGGVTTSEKITTLGKLLSGIDVTIIVTLRDPRSSLPSLYQQIYTSLPLTYQLSFRKFCKSGYARCFDYAFLAQRLQVAGLTRVRWMDFEKIATGELTTGDVFGHDDLWNEHTLPLSQLNVSAQAAGGKRTLPDTTARSASRNVVVRRLIDGLGLRGTRLTRVAGTIAERLPLTGLRSPTLEVPTDCLERLSSEYNALLRDSRT